MSKEIYFDNAATTRIYDEVLEEIIVTEKNFYANPASLHSKGLESEKKINKVKNLIADVLTCNFKEIIFTSGGTESNNLAILGFLEGNKRNGNKIITSSIEHPSVLNVYKYLENKGYEVCILKVDNNGKIDLNELENEIDENTSIISIMHVNNEIGSKQDIEKISNMRNMKNRKAALHVDAVQSFMKESLNLKKLDIDFMSFSSHKIHGPKGVGGLFISSKRKILPINFGGGQENGLRSGTQNMPGICGFGKAIEIGNKNILENYNKVSEFKKIVLENIANNSFRKISNNDCLPYILNLGFENLRGEVLVHHLADEGIFISTGSACSSKKSEKSHVARMLGIPNEYANGIIRISFSSLNTIEEVWKLIEKINTIVPKILYKSKRR